MEELEVRRRYRVEVGEPDRVVMWLVGCGGTGSFLALHLARMAWEWREIKGQELELVFVDPDEVERKNIGRQNFCPAEIGEAKAKALAERYSRAFGIRIGYMVRNFSSRMMSEFNQRQFEGCGFMFRRGVALLAGCVDGLAGRQEMKQAVKAGEGRIWWVDGGNEHHSGQVLIGNRVDMDRPEVSALGFCKNLPAPSVVAPELVSPLSIPPRGGEESCAEAMELGEQGLMVNQAVAGWMAVMIWRLVVSRDLDFWQVYVDLAGGGVRSVGIGD